MLYTIDIFFHAHMRYFNLMNIKTSMDCPEPWVQTESNWVQIV